MEFKKVKLGEIAKFNQKSYKSNYNWKTVKYLDTGNLNKNKVENLTTFNLRKEKLPSRAKRIPQINSILYSTVRPNQEHYGILENKFDNLLVSTGFTVIDIYKENINPKYIYYFLTKKDITAYLQKIAEDSVSTYPAIKPSDIKNLEILLPNRNNQDKIEQILSNLDSKIEINNKIISNLESQAQAIFKSWFVDFEPFQDGNFVESELGMIPEGWEVRELKDVSKRINGFSYTSKDIFDESNINMITIKNFDRNGGLQNDSIKPISKNSRIKKDHYLKTNDILMACTDLTQKADIIGGVLLYFENENFDNEIFSMDLIKLVPFEKDDTFFFYYYLKNPIFKLFAENASSGTTVLHLSKKAVDNFNIVYPTKKHIDRFNDYVFPIIKKQRNLLNQNTKLAELRDALLPKLMAGEIDVSNIKIEGEEVKNE